MDALIKEIRFKVSHTNLFNRINPNTIFTLGSHDNEVHLSIFLWKDSEMHEILGPIPFDEFGEPEDLDGAILIIENDTHAPKPELQLTLELKGYTFTMYHDPEFLDDIIIPRTEKYEEIEQEVNDEAKKVITEGENPSSIPEFINLEEEQRYLDNLNRKEKREDEEETNKHLRR